MNRALFKDGKKTNKQWKRGFDMKRVLLFLSVMVCLIISSAALADRETIEYIAEYINQRWVCETFKTQINADAKEAFSHRLLPDDEIVCGAEMLYYDHRHPDEPFMKDILMAVKRDDSMLLFAAKADKDGWKTGVESDSFLPVDAGFEITVTPEHDGQSVIEVKNRPYLAIVCGDERWEVIVSRDVEIILDTYTHKHDGIDLFVIQEELYCVFPVRLAAWTMDTFPGTVDELGVFSDAHQPDIESGKGYITGVNLREKPTGKSASMGKYTAKVKVLGSVPGEKDPWYNVMVGDLEGWVSGRYLNQDSKMRLCESEREMVPVARADRDLELKSASTGAILGMVPAGTLMHVIHDQGDSLHVVIPQGELTWKTDWDGTYGFVPADGVTLGTSAADLKWK